LSVYFEVQHETQYTYSEPVHLGRHTLRLRPISDANQHLHRFDIAVSPEPAGTSALSDLDGNYATAVWFEEPTRELVIRTESIVETLRSNPFDYLWQGDSTLPLHYSTAFSEALGLFRASMVPAPVRALGDELAQTVNGNAQAFPLALARLVHERFPRVIRQHGDPWDSDVTLQRGEGSCRDLAVLFMAVARSQGFAARFVSGYNTVPGENDEHDLHAWAEIYLPGGGWRGFDPTIGLAVADRHVAVAAGALAEQTLPVSGTYAGKATSRLDTRVSISEVPSLV
jgi:transglutaminase-like putative cysteine protease